MQIKVYARYAPTSNIFEYQGSMSQIDFDIDEVTKCFGLDQKDILLLSEDNTIYEFKA